MTMMMNCKDFDISRPPSPSTSEFARSHPAPKDPPPLETPCPLRVPFSIQTPMSRIDGAELAGKTQRRGPYPFAMRATTRAIHLCRLPYTAVCRPRRSSNYCESLHATGLMRFSRCSANDSRPTLHHQVDSRCRPPSNPDIISPLPTKAAGSTGRWCMRRRTVCCYIGVEELFAATLETKHCLRLHWGGATVNCYVGEEQLLAATLGLKNCLLLHGGQRTVDCYMGEDQLLAATLERSNG